MKIYSWNINGIRSALKKNSLQTFVEAEKPDILCIQETKIGSLKPKIIVDTPELKDYQSYYCISMRPGYSGTAVFIKNGINFKVIPLSFDKEYSDKYGNPKDEGRIICLDFGKFYLVNVYTPNSKQDLSRLALRKDFWDQEFLKAIKKIEQNKPIIMCGDFNAAHQEIDLARPKTNHKNAGFTDEERNGITNILNMDFIDTFRFKNPDVARYTWWSHWGHAREHNVGWRIDYFFISKSLIKLLKNAEIHEQYMGSDHCPISIEMDF